MASPGWPEHYSAHGRDTRPSYLVARVVPALSRSCRLGLDLPLLGVLTWLCGGAGRPRRGVATPDLYRRLREIFPGLKATERQLAGSLRRLWSAKLATVGEGNRWRPARAAAATVCRIDVAVWSREGLSPAAKRVHALFGHRFASGRSDAVEFMAAMVGMSRGRCGEALAELAAAGVIEAAGRRVSRRGSWVIWRSTGAQPKGVPSRTRSTRGHLAAAASPMVPWTPSRNQMAAGSDRGGTWGDAVAAACWAPGSMADHLRRVGVGRPWRRFSAAGMAGLAAMVRAAAARLERLGTTKATVSAWLVEQHARGLDPRQACAALATAIGRPVPLEAFVMRSGAERHLAADDARAASVAKILSGVALVRCPEPLPVARQCGRNGRSMSGLRTQLQELDSAYRRAGSMQRAEVRTAYQSRRRWLQAQVDQCPPFESTCTRTRG